jgi:hypothetical protein
MPQVGFEPTIPAFKRAKTVHALDRAAPVIGISPSNITKKILICKCSETYTRPGRSYIITIFIHAQVQYCTGIYMIHETVLPLKFISHAVSKRSFPFRTVIILHTFNTKYTKKSVSRDFKICIKENQLLCKSLIVNHVFMWL